MSKTLDNTFSLKNSIYDNLENSDFENEIYLTLHSGLSVIVVEGITDYKFWRKFIDKDNVEILKIYTGKSKVAKIIEKIKNEKILGIQDRDYYEGEEPDRIFFYDYNCLEIMLIDSEKVFNSLYDEYYLGNKKREDLKMDIFEQLKYISIIRKHNYKRNWELKLKNVISECYVKNCINIDKLIDEIDKRNKEKNINEKKHIFDNDFSKIWDKTQYLTLTRGHDYIKLLSMVCNKDRKNLNAQSNKLRKNKADEIESAARTSFDLNELKKTKIFSSLSKYEENYNLTIFIRG